MRAEKARRAPWAIALLGFSGLLLGLSANSLAQSAARFNRTTFTSFDVPGAVGTTAGAINPAGQIAGSYFQISTRSGEVDHVNRGYLRNPDGTIITFDVPGSVDTVVTGINPAGQIEGSYVDRGNIEDGCLRDLDDNITLFVAPVMIMVTSDSIFCPA